MKGKNIICFANDWENDPTSKHHIMKLLSNDNRILWVNSIGMRNPGLNGSDLKRITKKLRAFTRGLTKVNNNLYHFTPIVLPFPSSFAARAFNKRILKLSLEYYKKKLAMQDVQLWSFLPNIAEMVGTLGEKFVLYYCVDEWSQFSFMDGPAMKRMEIDLLRKSDLVVTSSEKLYRDKIQYNSRTHLITHGVDYEYFSKALHPETPVAEDIQNYEKPIIGFFGLIHEWVDLDLLERIASMRPDWSFVMIGKVSVDIGRFRNVKNVHFMGPRPYDRILHYVKGFDVGMIPFVINELTMNVNPIKLREYLASGIPVVSTPIPEVLKYRDNVWIGKNAEEIILAIEKAVKEDSARARQKRSAQMKMETWESKLEHISRLIDMHVQNHQGGVKNGPYKDFAKSLSR